MTHAPLIEDRRAGEGRWRALFAVLAAALAAPAASCAAPARQLPATPAAPRQAPSCVEGERLGRAGLQALAQARIAHGLPAEVAVELGEHPLQVVVRGAGIGRLQVNLDNLWVETRGDCVPSLAGLDSRIATLRPLLSPEGRRAPERDAVRALVRSRQEVERYLALARREGDGAPEDGPLLRPLAGELVVVYAFDQPSSVSWMSRSDLARLGLAVEDLETLAADNLWKSLSLDAHTSGDGTFVMLTAGGTYEASLMVVPVIWRRMTARVDGDPVVCVSNRDVLVTAGSARPADVAKLEALCRHLYETGSYAISPDLYRWADGRWSALASGR